MTETYEVFLLNAPDQARAAVMEVLVEYNGGKKAAAKKAWYGRKGNPVFSATDRGKVDFFVSDCKKALAEWPGADVVVAPDA